MLIKINFRALESRLSQWPKNGVRLLCLSLVLAAGWIDSATGADVIPLNLYLPPLALAAWFLEKRDGIGVAAIASTVFLAVDLLFPERHHPFVHLWNLVSVLGFFWMFFGLTRELHSFLLLRRSLSRLDELTHMSNQLAFEEAIGAEIRRKTRFHGPTSVAFVVRHGDLSPQKNNIRVQWEDWLRQTAQTIRMNLRTGELVARLDSDHFAFLLPDVDAKACKRVVEKIHYALNGVSHTNEWPFSFAIGAVTYVDPPKRPQDVMAALSMTVEKLQSQPAPSVLHELIPGVISPPDANFPSETALSVK
jgi:GGDEF domain-containing protein